jgi:hypothetical protein
MIFNLDWRTQLKALNNPQIGGVTKKGNLHPFLPDIINDNRRRLWIAHHFQLKRFFD